MLLDEEKGEFGLTAFQQAGVASALVAAVTDVFLIDVAVAGFQLSDKGAFRYLTGTQQPVFANIVGKDCQEQCVFPETAERVASLYQVDPQQRICLPLGKLAGEFLARQ